MHGRGGEAAGSSGGGDVGRWAEEGYFSIIGRIMTHSHANEFTYMGHIQTYHSRAIKCLSPLLRLNVHRAYANKIQFTL